MARLPESEQFVDCDGRPLFTLNAVNALPDAEKEFVYGKLLPPRLYNLLDISPETFRGGRGERLVTFIAPEGLSFARIEVRRNPDESDTVFFLEIADTHYRQMELSFCIICDPDAPRFDVDRDQAGKDNCFASLGSRNIPEEIRAMAAGLFPNQTRRGLRMFGEFLPRLESFVASLDMDMIVGEALTYDNAIRYEKYGFDYITGKLLMKKINEGFAPGGIYTARLDGSTPFRMPGMEKSVLGRSWAIHDGVLDEPWDEIKIYKMVGVMAGVDTFPDREIGGWLR